MTKTILWAALSLGAFVTYAPTPAAAEDAKKGNASFTIHYIYHPTGYAEVANIGKVTTFEASGPTENIKGEMPPFKDAFKNKCHMVSVVAAGKNWTEGACVTADGDGDLVFATFDSRNQDASQPKLNCGSYILTGGTGKFKGLSGSGAYSCAMAEAPKGEPAGSFAMDISHVENWQMGDAPKTAESGK